MRLTASTKDIEEMISKVSLTPIAESESEARRDYNKCFRDGAKKATQVLSFVRNTQTDYYSPNLQRLAYISVGGADGSEIYEAFTTSKLRKAVMLEIDDEYCEHARKTLTSIPSKECKILHGDAYANKEKCGDYINSWIKSGEIDGVIISAISVLHELPDRCTTQNYDHDLFFGALLKGVREAYLFSKEPTSITNWGGRVYLRIPGISKEPLLQFAKTLQEKFSNRYHRNKLLHSDFFMPVSEGGDGITLGAQLAGEVLKKLLYLMRDGSRKNLHYECMECHTSFDPVRFHSIIETYFDRIGNEFESRVITSQTNTETFRDLYVHLGVLARNSDDRSPLPTPNAFSEFRGWYRPLPDNLTIPLFNFEGDLRLLDDKSMIEFFFESIGERKYDLAFQCLSDRFKEERYGGDQAKFANGYDDSNLMHPDSLRFFRLKAMDQGSMWIVYFEESVNIYSLPWYMVNSKRCVADQEAYDQIERIKESLKKCGGDPDKVNKLPLDRLIKPNGLDECRWLAGITVPAMMAEFSRHENVRICRVLRITTECVERVWSIAKINDIRDGERI